MRDEPLQNHHFCYWRFLFVRAYQYIPLLRSFCHMEYGAQTVRIESLEVLIINSYWSKVFLAARVYLQPNTEIALIAGWAVIRPSWRPCLITETFRIPCNESEHRWSLKSGDWVSLYPQISDGAAALVAVIQKQQMLSHRLAGGLEGIWRRLLKCSLAAEFQQKQGKKRLSKIFVLHSFFLSWRHLQSVQSACETRLNHKDKWSQGYTALRFFALVIPATSTKTNLRSHFQISRIRNSRNESLVAR